MKLRLPHRFQAALIAALASVSLTTLSTGSSAYAGTRTDYTSHTTKAGNVTYNGHVFTMLNTPANAFATRHFKEATYDGETSAWVDGTDEYSSSNNAIDTPEGRGVFWSMYCSTATVSNKLPLGHTLRLSGATAQQKLETNFTDFTIGGLIADDNCTGRSLTDPAYWFWRGGSMDIDGAGEVNMDIDSYVMFSYRDAVNMKKGGTWNIHSGKMLVFDNSAGANPTTFKFYEGQALTVTGGGTLYLGRSNNGTYNVEMQEGSSLLIKGDSTVEIGAATGAITVNGTITVDTGSTLNITNNKIVTIADGASVIKKGSISGNGKISGTGTYELVGTTSLGVTLDDGWTGTVKISNVSGTAGNNINLDAYGNSSAVELDNVTGYLYSPTGGKTFNTKLNLGEGGLTLINGNSNYIYQFAGGVAGTGTFKVTLASGSTNPTYRFTGSVKDWTGSFELANEGKTANIAFENQATEVNAAVTRTAGTLNMVVGNGTDSFSTTFKNTVEASALTINAKASATFTNTASIGSITGAGDLYISNTGTLKLAGANTVSVGSLTLAEGAHLDVSNVIQMAGLTVNLASYTGTVTCTTDNITGVHSGMDYTLNTGNGQVTLTFAGEQPLPSHFTPTADLRNVMYVGDSITDGVTNQKSWRYSFFQVLADGGIGQNEEGYFQHRQSSHAIPDGTIATYGGREFQNTHSAQASARSYEVAGTDGPSQGRFDRSYIKNWLGQDDTKKNGQPYPEEKARYTGETAPNTYFMLLGTNDLLSDPSGSSHVSESHFNTVLSRMFGYSDGTYDGETGTFDIILDSMLKARSDAQLVIMEMPTWNPSRGGNHDSASDFAYMARFNQTLIGWAAGNANKEHITVVDPNRGMVDVANTTKPGAGVANMFISDGLHPSAQGELIMAGNMARQLGYAGRSVGLDRAEDGTPDTVWSSAESASITVVAEPQTFAQGEFHTLDGYTIDFGALYGNGITGGWSDPDNALSVQVGDGLHSGTLSFSEAYVMWGDTILYSRDNSQEGDNFRIAYVNSSVNAADHVTAGYYVWMGDQLIGEALTAGSGEFNGIRLTSSGAEGTVKNLTWSDTAYAPITNGYVNEDAAFHLVQVNPMPSHDANPEHIEDFNYDTARKETSDTIGNGFFGAVKDNTATADTQVVYTLNKSTGANAFGAVNASSSADIAAVFGGGGTVVAGNYSAAETAAFMGAYNGSISGKLSVEMNDITFAGNVIMGLVTNGTSKTVGSTELIVNEGAHIQGSVYGGHGVKAQGTITSGTRIVVTGGTITGSIYGGNEAGSSGSVDGGSEILISGGVINGNVNGGSAGGTFIGTTSVTVEGNLARIGGDITAQNVTLKDMATSGEGYTDGFDCYTGTITATTLTLDNYKVDEMLADVVAESLVFTNGSATTFKGSVTVGTTIMGDNSTITLSGTSSIAGVIAGNTTATVVFDNDITSTGLERTTRDYNVTLDGQEIDVDVTDANYFAGGQEGTLTVVSGGATVTTNGHSVVQDSISYALQDDGTAVGTVKEAEYATFYQHVAGSALDLSAINLVAAQHGQLLGVGKVDVEGATLTVDTGYVYNVVAKDATVEVASGEDVYGVGMLEFIGGENTVVGQVSNFGDHAAKFRENVESAVELQNADGSAYTLDLSSHDHVKFSTTEEDGGVVAISAAAEGDADEVYTAAESRYTVKATELAKATEGDATVGNHVEVAGVSNVFAGKLTLSSGAATEVLQEITTSNGGDIEFLNMAAANGTEDGSQTLVQLKALEIGADSTVSFYEKVEANPVEEARVTVETTLTATGAGARLNADLEMAVGSALDVSGTEGAGLILGSEITLNPGNLLAVDGITDMDYVDAHLRDYFGGRTDMLYTLYSGTEGDPLEFYIGDQLVDHDIKFKDWLHFDMDASEIYSNLYAQTYYLVYDGSNVGSIAIGLLPEPTTGTLSLLALCALAARRRRK